MIFLLLEYQRFLCEVQCRESSSSQPTLTLELFSGSFYTVLQDVIKCLNEFPNALEVLKKALSSLVLPLGDGKVVPIVEPSLFSDAQSVAEVFSSLSPLINPLSLNLLQTCVSATGYSLAVAKIAEFDCLRMSNGTCRIVVCSDKWTVPTTFDGLNDLSISARSGAEVAHTVSLDQLQSIHPSVFAKLSAAMLPKNYMRVSTRINRKMISLADYECLLTAISGFFQFPKSTLTYIGCTEQPLCLSWIVSKELEAYMKRNGGGVSGECMLCEQGVVNLMVGDWLNYHCPTTNVSIFIISVSAYVSYILIYRKVNAICVVFMDYLTE